MFLLDQRYWKIKETVGKGRGIFACKTILAGTIVGDYLGMIVDNAEYDLAQDTKGLYLMYLSDRASIYPDFDQPGIYLMNHSCRPNCGMYVYRGHTLFFAIQKIMPNEELTISYMLSPNICKSCTHQCKCGLATCSGTMHLSEEKYVLWENYQNRLRKLTKISRFQVGKKLKSLAAYPTRIPVNPIYKELSI